MSGIYRFTVQTPGRLDYVFACGRDPREAERNARRFFDAARAEFEPKDVEISECVWFGILIRAVPCLECGGELAGQHEPDCGMGKALREAGEEKR